MCKVFLKMILFKIFYKARAPKILMCGMKEAERTHRDASLCLKYIPMFDGRLAPQNPTPPLNSTYYEYLNQLRSY